MKASNSIVQHYLNLNDEMMTVEQMADMLHISRWGVLKKIRSPRKTSSNTGRTAPMPSTRSTSDAKKSLSMTRTQSRSGVSCNLFLLE